MESRLAELVASANHDGITAAMHGQFSSPPWVPGARSPAVFEALCAVGREMGLDLRAASSGGASDANKIASTGIPVLDSLGPVGSDIHSPNERVHVPSLVERAKLSATFLTKIAAGEIQIPPSYGG